MKNKLIFFMSVLIFLSGANAAKAAELNSERFCLIPVSVPDLHGIAAKEKWRAVPRFTVFDGSPHALFFSFWSHPIMRLNGYKMEPVEREELPYNALDRKKFFYDEDKNIYAQYKQMRNGPLKNYVVIMDTQTGKFKELSEETANEVQNKLQPIFNVNFTVGQDNQVIEFDRSDGAVYLDGRKIPGVYSSRFPSGKMDLAHPMYYPEFKQVFVHGYVKKYLIFTETGTFTWQNNRWIKIGTEFDESINFIPLGYSSLLNKIIFSGSKLDLKADGLQEGEFLKTFYYDKGGNMKLFYESPVDERLSPLDIEAINTTLLWGGKGIYQVNKDQMSLEPIILPEKLKSTAIRHLINMPASNAILIIASDGLYMMNYNFNILERPIFKMDDFGNIMGFGLIPVREEVFITSSLGPFLLVDKAISKNALCDD